MLEVKGLHTYYGRAHILAGVSLAARRGEVIALLGRNGAGKSTTLKSIIGLVRPARGELTFDGQPIAGLPAHAIARRGLGYVPEERRIFPDLTVTENLEVGRQPPREGVPAWTVGRLFGLFPNLEKMGSRFASHMSGGEQQMLTIARTLMGNPRCILLDEPSEGLAPVVVQQMAKTILALKREGLTVLLSEQNLNFAAALADRCYVLEKGRIRYEGAMADFAADEAARAAYLML